MWVLSTAASALVPATQPAARPAVSSRCCCGATMAANNKVVVTGVGVVSAVGNNDEFWSNLLAGNIGIVHGITGASRTFMGEEQAGVDAILKAHADVLAPAEYIGWDFAVTDQGPALIECNTLCSTSYFGAALPRLTNARLADNMIQRFQHVRYGCCN